MPFPVPKHVTEIAEIDGKNVNRGTRVHILPGSHTVSVSYAKYSDVNLCVGLACLPPSEGLDLSIDFMAEAGHEYRIPAERRGERNWIWVEDVTSGKVIAGEKPPELP